MIFLVRFRRAGAHVHCILFVVPADQRTFAQCGEFKVRDGAEFEALTQAFGAIFIDEGAAL